MFCSKCGAQNEDSATFCIKCGARLIALRSPQAEPPPAPRPVAPVEPGPAAAPSGRARPTAPRKTPAGAWVSVGGAILVLLLFFAPWGSCGGESFSGLRIATESEGEYTWVVAVPFCALAALGILYAFRREIRLSAWLRIAVGLGGLIPLVKLYDDMREVAQIEWGSIGTVLGLGAVILGGVQDLLQGSARDTRPEP